MANTSRKTAATDSIDAYLLRQPPHVRAHLSAVRALVHKHAPDVEECISYQMPAFRIGGRIALYCAGWAQHYALYPAMDWLEAFATELQPYNTSKGTVRFDANEPMPSTLIESLIAFRIQRHLAQAKPVRPAKAKPTSAATTPTKRSVATTTATKTGKAKPRTKPTKRA